MEPIIIENPLSLEELTASFREQEYFPEQCAVVDLRPYFLDNYALAIKFESDSFPVKTPSETPLVTRETD